MHWVLLTPLILCFPTCVFMSLKHYAELLNHLFKRMGDMAQLVVLWTIVCKVMEAGRLRVQNQVKSPEKIFSLYMCSFIYGFT